VKSTRWLRSGLWAAAFGLLWTNVCDDPPLTSGAFLQHVTADGVTVAKILAAPGRCDLSVYDATGVVVAAVTSEGRRRHALVVTGLPPVSRFRWTLASGGETEEGTFRTGGEPDSATIRFACLGDSGAQPWWVWLQRTPLLHWPARWDWFACSGPVRQVGAAVAGYEPDFVLHLGDVIYPKGQHAHYRTGFFSPFAAALRKAPFYAVVGNHDVLDAGGLQLLANYRMPANEVTGDARCLSFARGPLRILGIDCNAALGGAPFGAGHPSYEFLRRELAQCTEPWIVVASHFPMRSASRQGPRADLLLSVLPELAAHQVQLYLSGHDHCYQRFGQPEDGEPVLVVSGGGGKDLYDEAVGYQGPRPARFAKSFHWCSVEVAGRVLKLRCQGLDGAEIDNLVLRLPTGESLARMRAANPGRARRIDLLRE
jgi:hypothetical protein